MLLSPMYPTSKTNPTARNSFSPVDAGSTPIACAVDSATRMDPRRAYLSIGSPLSGPPPLVHRCSTSPPPGSARRWRRSSPEELDGDALGAARRSSAGNQSGWSNSARSRAGAGAEAAARGRSGRREGSQPPAEELGDAAGGRTTAADGSRKRRHGGGGLEGERRRLRGGKARGGERPSGAGNQRAGDRSTTKNGRGLT